MDKPSAPDAKRFDEGKKEKTKLSLKSRTAHTIEKGKWRALVSHHLHTFPTVCWPAHKESDPVHFHLKIPIRDTNDEETVSTPKLEIWAASPLEVLPFEELSSDVRTAWTARSLSLI